MSVPFSDLSVFELYDPLACYFIFRFISYRFRSPTCKGEQTRQSLRPRKAKEKVSNLDGENERLRQERVKLKEENEELQLAQVTGSPMRQLTPGTPPNDDFDLGGPISPEVKERILRLEHENKKLKNKCKGNKKNRISFSRVF
ncbi:Protein Hook 3 [Desmophyllum pertusum]|uniref:Protein Hook 3 n=1 Tax=Desmophyllum pertusum TaxID=174260 RepID=A0A9W9ZRQ5_9CNID|nr:Protein Hook 3 [Desmophyllum pertusum]